MTWALARPQIVSMVEAVDGLVLPDLFGERLRERKDARAGQAMRSRQFWLSTSARATQDTHGVVAGAERTFADVELAVYYAATKARLDQLDLAINSDYEAIRRALLGANTGMPTSTLISILPAGDELVPADDEEIEDEDGGLSAKIQRFRFTALHTEQS